MKLNIQVTIDVPNIQDPVEMTPAQFVKFADDITKFYADNYQALTQEDETN
jgi:hypothetical protein